MRLFRQLLNFIAAVALIAAAIGLVAVAFGYVLAGAWEYEKPKEDSRQETWMEVNGEPMHLTVKGPQNGPVMILLHGTDVEGSLTFTYNIEALSKAGIRVIAIDFPGFGYSTRNPALGYMANDQARLLGEIINAMQLKNVTLVGFQRGAAVALEYALQHPEVVARIALISPQVYHDARPLDPGVVSLPVIGRSLMWSRIAGPLLYESRRDLFANPNHLTMDYRKLVAGTTHIVGTNDFRRSWMTDQRRDRITGINRLSEVLSPVLILSGTDDTSPSAGEVRQLVQALQDAEWRELHDTGVYLHQEDIEQTNQRLIEFGLRGTR
ncbi:MAG: alpha/beta hydrolase [Chloroflexi bacterium]|nr:alpha/beta hydrolase [Chloroflexota bacterium]